ncbi:alpha/beta-hydrolase [Coccomyxa subellipsoidea C-169]|uniref:Alpha/beta-hydrolase n=1 Tax=Coccomyxa subellipsoidea (strain C-169) TaxID=574566 RepID=I0YW27_COCSC|nr:alpha/beta-hydrolase [Coccomyxa subellipsoidea C-169]EIE22596.1 alpha/beta-hydrolase [Coccomyxa subellipsoidea C-169]|eukprot:XP_005647140.1 alpha/beta-hydrolase [Coccomyxa subellipsoidea C-169]
MVLQEASLGEYPIYYGGVTPEVKEQAELISQKGNYRVLVPDLYKGKIGVNAEEAKHLASELDYESAIEGLKQSAEWLRANGATKVGVTGFCQGGSLALLAAEYAGVDAAAPFYGIPNSYPSHPEKIKVPVQAHVGDQDNFFPEEDVRKFVDEIKAAGGDAVLYVYPGEGHAFMNAQSDSIERMKTAGIPVGKRETQELAWSRLMDFFKKHLG